APPPLRGGVVETQLGRRQRPLSLRTLDLATRAIAAHCHHHGTKPPQLVLARVHDDRVVLEMAADDVEAPVAFEVAGATWTLAASDVDHLRTVPGIEDAVRPYPALATLGSSADHGLVVADLEALRLTSIIADDLERSGAALAALAVELSCSPWAEELELIMVDVCQELPAALGQHNVTRAEDLGPVLHRLERRAEEQRRQPSAGSVAGHRVDPDRVDPWAPTIVLINRPLSQAERSRLSGLLLGEPPVSIAAVVAGAADGEWQMEISSIGEGTEARIEPAGLVITPQLLEPPAVSAVIDLVETTGRTDTGPAPWWHDPDPPDNVTYLGRRFAGWTGPPDHDTDDREGAAMSQQGTTSSRPPSNPVLQLLGPVELDGAAGPTPTRAARQCLEYCGWLLEHPGTRAHEMATALVVAEGTRRSNVSRLRAWLGADDAGDPYLPDAYSGRIMLHPAVSSDWQRLQILTGRGINRTSTSGLEAALQLVRGAPLADAAPCQWHWAEGLRTDMISVIRDLGVELADRALGDSDIQLARWAATRALAAAPGDELLLVARIKTEHRAGNHIEVERLTLQLAAQARSLQVDLRPETVDVLQDMMEGRVRARLA
ncbi:MAG: hypothetical protein L0H41_12485, partial [Microlunatus sp.]|nr:hypothetical protein [Microlunatus sp.]